MRTIIIPDLVRVGPSGDPACQLEVVVQDGTGHHFALHLDIEACRALREALAEAERQLLTMQAPFALPGSGGPVA